LSRGSNILPHTIAIVGILRYFLFSTYCSFIERKKNYHESDKESLYSITTV
jgi:hypothetical protein